MPTLSDDFTTAPRDKAGFDTPYDVTVMDYSTDPNGAPVERPGGFELYRNYYVTFNPDGSYSLTLAGDFAFQKDYRLPQGGGCLVNGTVLPLDACPPQAGTSPVVPPTTSQSTSSPTALPIASSNSGIPGLPGLPQALPAPPPLAALSVTTPACSGKPYADVCGAAAGDAENLIERLPLLDQQLLVHQNPNRGITHVPTWYWATGYAGQALTSMGELDVPWVHNWIDAAGLHRSESGTYHLSIFVRLRPSRYLWQFGDGAGADTSSLGQAYPNESNVQHSYGHHSGNQPDDQYTYGLTVNWTSDWTVSGDASGQGTGPARTSTYQNSFGVDDFIQVRCPETGCVD